MPAIMFLCVFFRGVFFLPFILWGSILFLSSFSGWAHGQTISEGKNVFAKMQDLTALELSYTMYSSGFGIATQHISLIKNGNQLHIHNDVATNESISWLQDSHFVIEVLERIDADYNTPLTFRAHLTSSSLFSVKKRGVYVNYMQDGKNVYGFEPLENISPNEHPPLYEEKYTQNSTNWLSLMTKIANVYAQNPNTCKMKERIFDVDGSLTLKFQSAKKVQITDKNSLTKYRGEAIRCKVLFEPAPAKGERKIKTSTGDITIAKVMDTFYFPIRFYIASTNPRIILHLSNYSIRKAPDFQPLNLLPDIPY